MIARHHTLEQVRAYGWVALTRPYALEEAAWLDGVLSDLERPDLTGLPVSHAVVDTANGPEVWREPPPVKLTEHDLQRAADHARRRAELRAWRRERRGY